MTKKINFLVLGVVAALVLGSGLALDNAFAHGVKNFPVNLGDGIERSITVVMGHTNEPTHSQKSGVHDGKHAMEIFLRDSNTGLDLAGATLVADKFYFKDLKSFEKADSPYDADAVVTGVPVNPVHGDPGHYHINQILSESGIYGYKVTGNIDYFGVADVPVELTAFCREAPGKFNSNFWFGGFGCTTELKDSNFP